MERRSLILTVLAVVSFVVALVLLLVTHDGKLVQAFTIGGLALFAAGHL